MLENYGVSEANWRDAIAKQPHFVITETPRYVGRAVAHLAGDPEVARWSGQSLSSGQLAKVYGFTDLDGSQPDAWRYVREVQDAGKPAERDKALWGDTEIAPPLAIVDSEPSTALGFGGRRRNTLTPSASGARASW
jgi:hypothetical protein